MGRRRNIGFDKIIEERKMLSFFKIFQSSDLSSECMRAFSYSFISRLSRKDFSYKMVIRAQWGKTWHLEISKNPRYYYIERRGWDQFVSDNALGENEFITFTHRGNMVFHVNIYEQNGVEMLTPRKFQTMDSSSGIKKEGESSFKDVKKEEETDESAGRAEFVVRKRKTEESKSSKKKMERKKVKNGVETGESSRRSELKARKKKAEGYNTSKKKKKSKSKSKSKEVLNGVPEFKITIRKSYLKFLAIPKHFVDDHIPNKSKFFTVRHPNGIGSWKVLCLVREIRTIFSGGYSKLAREYPLMVGDKCTFKLIKPFEFVLLTSKKTRDEIDHYMID
ncbi:B3 domain-containing protein At3g17010 isoform X1 [Arabidopsis lyrata subsp. lyrata]|uniref:B3 domain-containing protein At3g17010 isoform X1 n=1 Tax=Arabidopsis lyrata subsp. lyrata TaxID=81972 RepID=UPI000A29C85B|nr:B3 domain-containing protein At3g17010 isoform X1 [Arabidopsis lyrata subsp. lyrata]|eukprot:XP_020889192.1 B3 domain-containing protein At3g17010 isoform X1 [Arabidopsis lyrata subsp. lyrata]